MENPSGLFRSRPHRPGFSPTEAGPAAAPFALPSARLQPLYRERVAPANADDRHQALLLGPAYLLVLGLVELLDALTSPAVPFLGPAFFGAALLLLLLHAGLCWGRPLRSLPLALAGAPALRLALLLGPAGPAPVLIGLALGLPALLAAAVTLHLWGELPGWEDIIDALGRRGAALRQRLAPRGLGLLALPVLTMLLAVGGGLLVTRVCDLPVAAAGPPGRAAPPGFLRAAGTALLARGLATEQAKTQAGFLHSAGSAPAGSPAALLDDLHAALARPLRELMAGAAPQDASAATEPARLALRSDARQPRLVGAVLFEPGPADLRLAREDKVAVIPLWEEAGRPTTALLDVDDALAPHFVPPPPPKPPTLADLYPDCPGSGYGNPYPRGVCTWYAKDRRPDLVGFWGDYGLAINWPYAAAACGYRVDAIPAAGAVIVFPPGANGAYEGGHVGYVEAVEEDALLISECNVTHDSAGIVEPRWWEAGYSCAFRRIPWTRLSPRVQYIHGWAGALTGSR